MENEYIITDISHQEAVKGNIYFYILLSVIGGKNKIVSYTANHLTGSEKTSQYLRDYEEKHNLHYEDCGRECGKYLIHIMHDLVEERNGHRISKYIELPI